MRSNKFIIFFITFFIISGCKKLVEIAEPVNTLTTNETFNTVANANAAIAGIYEKMIVGGPVYLRYASGMTTIDAGMSADELNPFGTTNPFQTNTLVSNSGQTDGFWDGPYFSIYQANVAIEGLQASNSLPIVTKAQLIAEAKFLRAFGYFYLVNYFGDVPLALTSSYATNSLLSRTPSVGVYDQIISDLKDAKNSLPLDYSVSNGERIRANSWTATALLARVYLYQEQWTNAEAEATSIINNSAMFSLVPDLNSVFLKNSNEAILQLFPNGSNSATPEGFKFIPASPTSRPNFFLTSQLLNSFEAGDLRKVNWVGETTYSGTTYYYPYKYHVRTATSSNVTEYPMLLRLAEQYLIRAEARAHQNKLPEAISDLNLIRERAGLSDLASTLTQTQVLDAVAQERRMELFVEFGHRWFDLKRTNQADAVLVPLKPQWKPTAILYPIPFTELQTDPNLQQNLGY